jgi:FkbM family methyltransferase
MRYWMAASAETLVSRRNLVRGARFLLDYARRDLPNTMEVNGEWLVQDTILAAAGAKHLTVFDVGANVGAWTQRLLTVAKQGGVKLRVHAFEPAASTYEQLTVNLLPCFEDDVVMVRCAASDRTGRGTLFKVHELAGSNSLHGVAGSTEGLTPEAIDLCTLDDYCRSLGIETIDLLKIDAEGHDHLVLTGARGLLERKAVEVIQFEYNHRWIGARRYLKDVFDDLVPLGYEIGKVTPRAIEWYPAWSAQLETYREGNYLAVRPSWRHRFPSLEWWFHPAGGWI